MNITKFSPEVCEKIGYYVYRLVDPRDGQTFYVGKGKGNRVFAHVNEALDNYDGENYRDKDEDEVSLKLKTIRAIKDSGLDVIHIIQKYNLTNADALKIESVLIDVYSLDHLGNKIKGFDSNSGPINALTLERIHSAKEYEDGPETPPYVIIKINDNWMNSEGRYERTRSAWKANLAKAKKYPYVLSVTNGIVRAVYKVKDWHYSKEYSRRIEFDGEEVDKKSEISTHFLDMKIPAKYRQKGQASPFLYKK